MAIDSEPNLTNRPYPPPSTVIAVLQRVRSRNLPDRMDAEYLRDSGVPDSLNARTLFAFRFLGLILDDHPTEHMRAISTSTDEEYQAILSDRIKEAYREVLEVIDPEQDTPDRILNVFRRYTPASQRPRMVNFFLGMCKEAGFATVDAPKTRPSGVVSGAKPASVIKKPVSPTRSTVRTPVPDKSSDRNTRSSGDIAPALELLIRSLPPEGKPMSRIRREQWLEMARATLTFLYPEERDEALVEL